MITSIRTKYIIALILMLSLFLAAHFVNAISLASMRTDMQHMRTISLRASAILQFDSLVPQFATLANLFVDENILNRGHMASLNKQALDIFDTLQAYPLHANERK